MIQPLSYIHSDAKVADNVIVEPFTTIHKNVEIGEGTWVGSNVTIMSGAKIGKNCKIFPGSVISGVPQDLKFDGEDSLAVIGDNTTIRESVTINRGTANKGITKIGKNCLIMAYSHIAHDCSVGDFCVFSNNSTLAGHIEVGDHVILAGLAAIHQFCTIGDFAFISGGSLVRKDVPPFVKAAREPLSYMGVNSIGLRRQGFESENIQEIQTIYRILFQQKNNISQAVRIIEAEINATPERDKILQFVNNSKRGLMKGYL